jgi:uncharacterized membrane protein
MRPGRHQFASADGRTAALLLLGALVLTTTAALPPGAPRAALALPIALVLPGCALVAVLLRQERRDPALALAAGGIVSVAFYALVSLVLYGLGIRITVTSVILSVDVVVAGAATLLLLRPLHRRERDTQRTWALAAVASAAALAALLAVTAARVFVPPSPAPLGFSSLSFDGTWAQAQGAPQLAAGRRLRFAVRLGNETDRAQQYQLVASLGGRTWQTRTARLGSGRASTVGFDGVAPAGACSRRLSVVLFDGPPRRRLTSVTMQLRSAAPACLTSRSDA